jgi:hypothetical protein
MQIQINVPDAVVPEMVDALCQRYGYQATLPDPNVSGGTIPNPETRAQFAKRQISVWLNHELIAYRRWLKEQQADNTDPGITA